MAKANKAKEQYRKEAESLRRRVRARFSSSLCLLVTLPQLDALNPEKFLEVGERARAAEENLEKANAELTRLTRLVKEYAACVFATGLCFDLTATA